MTETSDKIIAMAATSQQKAAELMEKLLGLAEPHVVFGEPVESHGYTLITAAEVTTNMGYGFGMGGGEGTAPAQEGEGGQESGARSSGSGGGAGGGGGGAALSRPVAVISVGPDGVRVQPVVDATKIALAWFTALGTMFVMLQRMRRPRRNGK